MRISLPYNYLRAILPSHIRWFFSFSCRGGQLTKLKFEAACCRRGRSKVESDVCRTLYLGLFLQNSSQNIAAYDVHKPLANPHTTPLAFMRSPRRTCESSCDKRSFKVPVSVSCMEYLLSDYILSIGPSAIILSSKVLRVLRGRGKFSAYSHP